MPTTPQEFMQQHLVAFKTEAEKATPARRREMVQAIVLAASDVLTDKDMPHEPLSMLTSYICGQPADATLYQNMASAMDVLGKALMHHQDEPATVARALAISSLMSRALCAASSSDKDEVYLPASWNALLDAMNLSNLVGGLPRFASAWQHRLFGGTRIVSGFFTGSGGSA